MKLIAKQIMSVYKSVKRTLLENTLGALSQRLERPLIKTKIWNISINKSTVFEYIILKTSRADPNDENGARMERLRKRLALALNGDHAVLPGIESPLHVTCLTV